MSRSGDTDEMYSLTGRTEIWGFAVDRIAKSPFFGHGCGCARFPMCQFDPFPITHAHNLLLNVMLDTGIPGGIILVAMLLAQLRAAYFKPRAFPDLMTVMVLVSGFADVPVFSPIADPATLLWILALVWRPVVEWQAVASEGGRPMRIDVIPASRLSDDHRGIGPNSRRPIPNCKVRFSSPLHLRGRGGRLRNVEVAVMKEAASRPHIFPFQRHRADLGIPVGGSLSDSRAVMARQGFAWNAAAMFALAVFRAIDSRSCSFRRAFSSLPLADSAIRRRWTLAGASTPIVGSPRSRGTTLVSRIRDKARKAARDFGPIRFESRRPIPWHCRAARVEIRQYRRIQHRQSPRHPGTLDFLNRLLDAAGKRVPRRALGHVSWRAPRRRAFRYALPGRLALLVPHLQRRTGQVFARPDLLHRAGCANGRRWASAAQTGRGNENSRPA